MTAHIYLLVIWHTQTGLQATMCQNIRDLTLTFHVKSDDRIGLLIYDILHVLILLHEIYTFNMTTCQGHSVSNVMIQLESTCRISFYCTVTLVIINHSFLYASIHGEACVAKAETWLWLIRLSNTRYIFHSSAVMGIWKNSHLSLDQNCSQVLQRKITLIFSLLFFRYLRSNNTPARRYKQVRTSATYHCKICFIKTFQWNKIFFIV